MNQRKLAGAGRQLWQQGIILPITLIVLVAMTLAGIALVRSVDTASVIAGNLAFKQSAIPSGDAGIDAAMAWLAQNTNNLTQDNPARGYYATRQDALDLTANKRDPATVDDDLDWDGNGAVVKLPKDAAGNQVAYVIHRMCDNAGILDSATCSVEQVYKEGTGQTGTRPMETGLPPGFPLVSNRAFYRITARISGPRNTTSYVQAVVSI